MAQIEKRTASNSVRQPLNPFLMGTVRQFRPSIASVFAFGFFINLLTLAVPLYLLQIYSKVLPSGSVDTLVFLTGMALVAIAALGALEAIRRSILSKVGVRFEHMISEHLLNSAIQRALVRSETSVNVMRDLSNLRSFVSGSSIISLLDLPFTPLFLLILFFLHPLLGAIGIFGALLMLTIAIINERLTREPVKAAGRENRDLMDVARGYVQNADVVQSMGMQNSLLSRWNERNERAMISSYRAGRLNTRLASISKMIRLCLLIGIICAAAWLIMSQQLTAGATIASVLLMRRAISPIEQSIKSWKSVISARKAFQDISEYLNHASSLDPQQDMPVPDGTLKVERAGYRVKGRDQSLFTRVTIEARPGKLTALVGPTATGKSTLLRVMAGFAAPRSGRVTLGGFDIDQWSAEQRGPYIGYLPQDVKLFEGTIRENIARMSNASIETVIEAARLANVHSMIQALPEGYETTVDADGTNLSGGQQQKIGLARAVFGPPRYVLLDEPDANLDSDGRSALRKTIRSLRDTGVAVVAVTHHASLEKLADRVYRLESGKVERVRRTTAEPADEAQPLLEPTEPLAADVSERTPQPNVHRGNGVSGNEIDEANRKRRLRKHRRLMRPTRGANANHGVATLMTFALPDAIKTATPVDSFSEQRIVEPIESNPSMTPAKEWIRG